MFILLGLGEWTKKALMSSKVGPRTFLHHYRNARDKTPVSAVMKKKSPNTMLFLLPIFLRRVSVVKSCLTHGAKLYLVFTNKPLTESIMKISVFSWQTKWKFYFRHFFFLFFFKCATEITMVVSHFCNLFFLFLCWVCLGPQAQNTNFIFVWFFFSLKTAN